MFEGEQYGLQRHKDTCLQQAKSQVNSKACSRGQCLITMAGNLDNVIHGSQHYFVRNNI